LKKSQINLLLNVVYQYQNVLYLIMSPPFLPHTITSDLLQDSNIVVNKDEVLKSTNFQDLCEVVMKLKQKLWSSSDNDINISSNLIRKSLNKLRVELRTKRAIHEYDENEGENELLSKCKLKIFFLVLKLMLI